MAEEFNFEQALSKALEEKVAWVDRKIIPDILENYRLLLTAVTNLMNFLAQKRCIVLDPYRLDRKVKDIEAPEDSDYPELERHTVIGNRISEYERVLDFLCNYFKFSVQTLTLPKIKRLVALNNSFQWNSLSVSTQHPNTKGMAQIIAGVRQGADPLTASILNGSISTASKMLGDLNTALKQVSEVQREVYKMDIRKKIVGSAAFSWDNVTSPSDGVLQIKKLFPSLIGKRPFYSELVKELVEESIGANAVQLQQNLLGRLQILQPVQEKKVRKLDTKLLIMDAVRNLSSIAPQLDSVLQKLQENSELLQSQHNTSWTKFLAALRKAFGLKSPPIEYLIPLVDPITKVSRQERVNFSRNLSDISRRMHFLAALSDKSTSTYQKFCTQSEQEIYSFLTKQLSECQHLLTLLIGYDKFFKSEMQSQNKSKVKGLSMENTTIKNAMVKTNQRKAEYMAYLEEQQQLNDLGIFDEM